MTYEGEVTREQLIEIIGRVDGTLKQIGDWNAGLDRIDKALLVIQERIGNACDDIREAKDQLTGINGRVRKVEEMIAGHAEVIGWIRPVSILAGLGALAGVIYSLLW